MSEHVRVIFGVPYKVGKGFEAILDEYGIKELDTGASYPSEKTIGDDGLPAKYTIHTKARGWTPGAMTYNKILESAAQSFKNLGVEKVDTYFLHSPDPATPISETLAAIQKLYEENRFKHFGLSNFLPNDVQQVYDHCKANNYVLPTVYEGYYNPVGRHAETALFPLLRKLQISFSAYGALAGGFLTKTPSFFASTTSGGTRWDKSTAVGQLYDGLYNRPSFIAALGIWDEISSQSGIPKADLSYRWVVFHSRLGKESGDAIILGAGRPEQLRDALEGLKRGPLDSSVVEKIERIWETVRDEAVMDNFNKDNKG